MVGVAPIVVPFSPAPITEKFNAGTNSPRKSGSNEISPVPGMSAKVSPSNRLKFVLLLKMLL